MSTLTPGRVLVIEDDGVQRLMMVEALRRDGHKVEHAADAGAGLVLARGWLPDVVLLDRFLPDLDGLEVVHALQADPGTSRIPIVMVTSTPEREFVVQALDSGAHDYLSKPFLEQELLARINVALRTKRLHDELAELADHDALTGLFNRRAILSSLRVWNAHSARHAESLAVVLFDVNGFKQINDTLGHQAGDQVLVALAATMKRCLRADDVIGRWGGDEFLAVLPRADLTVATMLVGRLNAALATRDVLPDQPLSVRAGITTTNGRAALVADQLVAEASDSLLRLRPSPQPRIVRLP